MVKKAHSGWGPRLAALLLWGLTGAAAVLWGLRLTAPGLEAPLPSVQTAAPAMDLSGVRQVLGAVNTAAGASGSAAPAALPGVVLAGVIASHRAGQGVALLAVGGQPARPFRVGELVRDGLWLQSVEAERVHLSARPQGPVTQTLELPKLRRPTQTS